MQLLNVEGVQVPIGDHQGKKIVIGSDHGGFELKSKLIPYLEQLGYSVDDIGTDSANSCDFPEFASKVSEQVSKDSSFNTIGVIACKSGNGVAIVSNKYNNIIAARCLDIQDAESSRIHLNSNILTLAADKTSEQEIKRLLEVWLRTPFYSDSKKHANYLRRYVQVRTLEND